MKRWLWTVVFLAVGSASPAFGELQLEVNPADPSTQTPVSVTVSDEFGSTCFRICDVNGYWVGPAEYHIDWYIREYTSQYCSTVISRRSSKVDLGLLEPADYLVTATEYVTMLDDPCESAILTAETETTFHVTEAPPVPCPIEGGGNCQMCSVEDSFVLLSDLTVPPAGAVHADDFVPETTQIDSICVWGTYLDGSYAGSLNHSCSGAVEDNFRVRVYDDHNGLPGDLIAERWVSDPVKSYVPDCPGWNSTYEENLPLEVFTLSFYEIAVVAGQTHWLEVANKTDVPAGGWGPTYNTCYWHWMQVVLWTTEGNRVNAAGTDDRCAGGYYRGSACDAQCADGGYCDNVSSVCIGGTRDGLNCCPGGVCKPGYGGGYIDGSERWSGSVFCLGNEGAAVNFTPGDEVTGACCDCEGICVEDLTQVACADYSSGSERIWTRGGVCTSPAVCDPPPGDVCADGPIPIKDGLYSVDTSCATGDFFPSPIPEYEGLANEVWYSYTTTCTGVLNVSMCASSGYYGGYDSYLAIYHDWDNPTECPCPGVPQGGLVGDSDEDCNGIDDGGAGYYGPQIVFAGECWLIGIGSWTDMQTTPKSGRGFLDVACQSTWHAPPSPPEPEMIGDQISTKNRFLSIVGTNQGRQTAIRVTAVTLPPPFDVWIGQEWYVGEPRQYCEGAGQGSSSDPGTPCGPAPDVYANNQDWFWGAPLVCDPFSAHYMDWTTLADRCNTPGRAAFDGQPCWDDSECGGGTCGVSRVVHLYHEAIVPSHMAAGAGPIDIPAVYDIQAIDSISSIGCEWCYSAPLTITQPGYGDINTDVSTCPNGPPDGSVGVVTDVVGGLNKFANLPCAMQKARVDLVPCRVDFNIGIPDIVASLDAFTGGDYEDGCGTGQCGPLGLCKGGPDHGILCTNDDDCSSDPCGLDP